MDELEELFRPVEGGGGGIKGGVEVFDENAAGGFEGNNAGPVHGRAEVAYDKITGETRVRACRVWLLKRARWIQRQVGQHRDRWRLGIQTRWLSGDGGYDGDKAWRKSLESSLARLPVCRSSLSCFLLDFFLDFRTTFPPPFPI